MRRYRYLASADFSSAVEVSPFDAGPVKTLVLYYIPRRGFKWTEVMGKKLFQSVQMYRVKDEIRMEINLIYLIWF